MKKILLFLSPFCLFADSTSAIDPSLESVSYEGALIKMLTTLGGLLLLVFLTLWLLKKFKQGHFNNTGGSKKIVILEKRPLSPKSLLYLIEVEGKKILISESQLEVRMLSQEREVDAYE